jgi:hypothetical protein
MTLFNKVFSTRALLQIICVLGAVVAIPLRHSAILTATSKCSNIQREEPAPALA